jgi:hypothetical protein
MLQNCFLVSIARSDAAYLEKLAVHVLTTKGMNNDNENKVLVICSVVTYNTIYVEVVSLK